MAYAFTQAGFEAYDVHMTDLHSGRAKLADFMLETRYGMWGGQAALKFKGASKKKRTFGKVEFLKVDSGEGRLANIIQKDADASKATMQ